MNACCASLRFIACKHSKHSLLQPIRSLFHCFDSLISFIACSSRIDNVERASRRKCSNQFIIHSASACILLRSLLSARKIIPCACWPLAFRKFLFEIDGMKAARGARCMQCRIQFHFTHFIRSVKLNCFPAAANSHSVCRSFIHFIRECSFHSWISLVTPFELYFVITVYHLLLININFI